MNYLENTINQSFLLKSKLSSGTFGIVYSGIELKTHEEVAIKMSKSAKNVDSAALLKKENKILSRLQGIQGIPTLKWHGSEGDKNFLIMSLHSRDLGYLSRKMGKFSLKTIVMLAERMIDILDNIHKRGVLHRDIKPENILVGKKTNSREVYLVDFGISKFFKDSLGRHLKFSEGKKFVGTCRYSSLAAHKGKEIGRKDDLENLGYVLVYLFNGMLPWQKYTFAEEDKYMKVGALKEATKVEALCHNLPEEFHQYFEYIRHLEYYDKPDYKYLKSLFYNLASSERFNFDYKWDWLTSTGGNKPNSDSSVYVREQKEHRKSSIEMGFTKMSKSRERYPTQDHILEKKRNSELSIVGSPCMSEERSYLAKRDQLDEFQDEHNINEKMQNLCNASNQKRSFMF